MWSLGDSDMKSNTASMRRNGRTSVLGHCSGRQPHYPHEELKAGDKNVPKNVSREGSRKVAILEVIRNGNKISREKITEFAGV